MRRWMVVSVTLFLTSALGVILSTVQAASTQTLFVSSSEGGSLFRIDLATGTQTLIASGLSTPEGLACGPDDRVYIAESALFQFGVGRKISRVNQDGTDYTVVLDFASTPELAGSGGPEGPNIMEDRRGTSGRIFFNTRATGIGGSQPHTGSWSATRTGKNVTQVLLPFAGATGNAEGSDFLFSGPFVRNFLTVDFPNGRVLRAGPPFSQPQTGTDFITGLTGPNGMSVNPLTGNVYVAESFTGTIKIFTDTGAGPTGTLACPVLGCVMRKIDFDEGGNLFVATTNGPVVEFPAAGGPATTVGTIPGGNGVALCRTPDHN